MSMPFQANTDFNVGNADEAPFFGRGSFRNFKAQCSKLLNIEVIIV